MKNRIIHRFNKSKWDSLTPVRFKNISFDEFIKLKIVIQVGIITANDTEKKALDCRLKNIEGFDKFSVIHDSQTYYIARFGVFNTVVIKLGSMGVIAPDAATLSVNELIKTWNPEVIIAIGVAMGMKPDKQSIGDVVISKEIVNYDMTKKTEDGDIDRSPRPTSDSALYDRFTNCSEWSFYLEGHNRARLHHGQIITGASLVNDESLTEELRDCYPDAIGNEMEASGIWAASERNRRPWIIVKGISDWGMQKRDGHQPLAATSAISLCETVLSKEDALSGIVKNIKKKSSIMRKINSLKLYYYRRKNNLSEKGLAEKSKIGEIEIIKYESFNIGKGRFDKDCFPSCSLSDIEKLERILLPKKEDSLEVKNNQHNFMGYLLSCYFKNRLNKPYNRVKAVVFDFDGTLTKSDDQLTTWQRIWIELGYSVDECNKLHQDFDNKKISHQEWCNKTCKKFQEKHLTKKMLSDISSRISLIEGCVPTFRKLKENNLHLYIVSGSINEIIVRVLGDQLVCAFTQIKANEMVFDEKNRELNYIKGTIYDFEGKCNYILKIAKELKIHPYEILFVGNSNNDELAYKSGAVTLCVNPKSTNEHNVEIWNYRIENMRTLTDILPYAIPDKDI